MIEAVGDMFPESHWKQEITPSEISFIYKTGAGNGAGGLSFHVGRLGRAVPDLFRSAAVANGDFARPGDLALERVTIAMQAIWHLVTISHDRAKTLIWPHWALTTQLVSLEPLD
jgi:hypothetical protein